MIRVRAEINLSKMPAGTEHDVDPKDPRIAGLLRSGHLTRLDRPNPFWCYDCSPPTRWDTGAGLASHRLLVHEGKPDAEAVGHDDRDEGLDRASPVG